MAEILICAKDPEVRHLLEQALVRLGHEPLPHTGAEGGGDLVLVDADDPRAVEHGALLIAERPELPVVALSIYSAGDGVNVLDPAAHVLKPFTRTELERAVTGTLERWPTASAPIARSAI